jgi:uncharacterized protein
MMIIFVLVFFVVLALLHFAIYKTFLHLGFITDRRLIIAARIKIILLAISFPLMSMLASRYDGSLVKILYLISAVWIGTGYVLIAVVLVYWFLFGASKILMLDFNPKKVGGILFSLAILLSAYGIWHSTAIKIRKVDISISNLPSVWKGRTAVLVADTHFGDVRGKNFSKRVSKVIQELQPDIVFIAGDYFDGVKVDNEAMTTPWQSVGAPLGTYFANGNHEHYNDTLAFNRAIESAGIRVLNSNKVEIDGLQIIGTDYADTTKKESFVATLEKIGIDRNKPSVLIKHVPDNIEVARDAGISLQVSGHTHSGQVFPFNLLTHKIFKGFDHGLKNLGETQVYTTSGVGTWGPPQRIGTDAEIILIRFK